MERQRDVYRHSLEQELEDVFRHIAARVGAGESVESVAADTSSWLKSIILKLWVTIATGAYTEQRQVFLHGMSDEHTAYLQEQLDVSALDNYAASRASQLMDYTVKTINLEIHAGKDLFNIMQDVLMPRVPVIANREVVGAQTYGYDQAAEDLPEGYEAEKTWLTQRDSKVRDSHAELDGVKIPLNEVFSNGCRFPGDPDGAPEEVVNCRCTALYTLVR